MKSILDFLGYFNWLALPQVILETLLHADWENAYQRAGVWGLLIECLHSLIGTNTWPFFVSLEGIWNGPALENLLGSYGIKTWGWAFTNDLIFFRVRKSQAAWAQYLLLQAGVPLSGRLLAQERTAHSGQVSQHQRRSHTKDLGQQLGNLVASLTSFLDNL